jgi:DNA polymerase elongation subunit (family B)
LNADPGELVIRRVVGRRDYSKKTLEASAVKEYRRLGFEISPGMAVEFLVVDSRRKAVRVRDFESFDIDYYLSLLRRAWEEIEFLIRALKPEN